MKERERSRESQEAEETISAAGRGLIGSGSRRKISEPRRRQSATVEMRIRRAILVHGLA